MNRYVGYLGLVATLMAAGCAKDRILPVDSHCGDGQVTGEEQCDVDSPGCVDCRIVPGWRCPDDVCTGICGDGKLEGTEQCDPPNGLTCDDSCQTSAQSGCQIGGYFAVRQTDYSRDTIVGQIQTSSNWYFYHFVQTGSAFEVDQALYCGIHVTGTVTVSLDDGGYRALLHSNRQDAGGAHGARHGTFVKNGDNCDLSFDRWYLLRAADESTFLPADFAAKPALSALTPLPFESDPLNPTGVNAAGATDPDGDGHPGLALHLTGNLAGLRSVVQRDWNEYSPDPAQVVPAGSIEFSARSTFDNEERVLSVGDCSPAICSLLQAGSTPARDLPGHATFRFLGTSLDDPRVSAIAAGAPGADDATDMATCENVRNALPHQPYME